MKVGVGRRVITPPVGTLLFGYRPDTVSTSVHDDLRVNAIYFESKNARSLWFSVEVCLLATSLCDEIRKVIEQDTGIPAEAVIVSATHTHSGPATVVMEGWGDMNTEFCNGILIPQAREAAKEAISNARAAELGIGTTESLVGINRRELDIDGNVKLGQNPWMPFDPCMTLVAFRDVETKEPIANLVHYCCHGTAAGRNFEITRDWSGIMLDRLEKEVGGCAMFFGGAEGDVGPRLTNKKTTGDITHVRELGGIAANDAMRAYRAITTYQDTAELTVESGELFLPYQSVPTKEEVDRQMADFLAEFPDPESLCNIKYLTYKHLLAMQDYYKQGSTTPEGLTLPQTVVAIGPILIVPFPFEMFVEISLRLRKHSPYPYTLCLSNCNGAFSYLPTQDQLCRGGYEIKSFYNGNLFTMRDDTDVCIVKENLKLINTMKEKTEKR